MKRIRVLVAGGSMVLAAVAGFAVARSTPPDRNMTPEEMQKMAEQMMALAQPGAEHEVLARMAGEWATHSTFSMMPDQPEQHAEGRSSSRMILGGRFLEVRTTGEFMGKPFEGLTLMGYDRRHDHYTLVGFDTMGTYFVTGAGNERPDGTLVLTGETHDPKLNHTEKYDFVFKQDEDDRFRWEVWFYFPDGTRHMVVSNKMKRVR